MAVKIKDIQALTYRDILAMDEKTVRAHLNRGATATNARINRINNKHGSVVSPAVKKAAGRTLPSGLTVNEKKNLIKEMSAEDIYDRAMFSTKKLTSNEQGKVPISTLRGELSSMVDFLNSVTSTNKGIKKVEDAIAKRIGNSYRSWDEDTRNNYWSLYAKATELNRTLEYRDSTQLQQLVKEAFDPQGEVGERVMIERIQMAVAALELEESRNAPETFAEYLERLDREEQEGVSTEDDTEDDDGWFSTTK